MTTQNNYVMHIAGPNHYYRNSEGYTNKTRCKLIVTSERAISVAAFLGDSWFSSSGNPIRCFKCNSLVNDFDYINSVDV